MCRDSRRFKDTSDNGGRLINSITRYIFLRGTQHPIKMAGVTPEMIQDYIRRKGGRVKNVDLVKHFRKHLLFDDPVMKGERRVCVCVCVCVCHR